MFRISYSIGRRLQTRGKARNDAEKRGATAFLFEVSLRGKGETTTTVAVVMTIMSIEKDLYDLKENKRRLHAGELHGGPTIVDPKEMTFVTATR